MKTLLLINVIKSIIFVRNNNEDKGRRKLADLTSSSCLIIRVFNRIHQSRMNSDSNLCNFFLCNK